jgi:rhodanese-related sulfurtransferase
MQNKLRGYFRGISAGQFREALERQEPMFLLDVRNPGEYEQMRLGVGERLIPLGQLRARMDELPQEKNVSIVLWCQVSLRGYEAARILLASGYTNVLVLEGGLAAWPFAREK